MHIDVMCMCVYMCVMLINRSQLVQHKCRCYYFYAATDFVCLFVCLFVSYTSADEAILSLASFIINLIVGSQPKHTI